MSQNIAIGIDFGTSNSCVAVFQNAKVEIIATIPSFVAFTDNERLIGTPAKIQESVNPTNTISNIKRLIRHPWSQSISKSDTTRLPFEVINEEGRPKIITRYKRETKYFCPEEISAMVIARLKDLAEEYLDKRVSNVVMSVPASFNYFERLAIRNAATVAGLRVMGTISSGAAAAMAYNSSRTSPEAKKVLIFDLGGGTTNVSIVEQTDGFVEVIATLGHSRLGGEDFDNRLVDHLVKEFKSKNSLDLSSADKRVFQCLKRASQKAKHTLSTSNEATIEIDSLYQGFDFYTTISRAKFEELNADLFCTALGLVREAISDAKLNKSQIHDVVLVGGSSRIPKIRKLIQNFFNGREPNTILDPDKAVAYGAAIKASILNGDKSECLRKRLLLDATPFTLGIEGENGDMIPVIRRNWHIPTKGGHNLDSSMLEVKICEGEHARAQDNNILAKYKLPSSSPKGPIKIEFDIDADHNLSLSMVEITTDRRNEIQINYHDNSISKEDIERMISDAKKYRQDDQRVKNATTAKIVLESCCTKIKTRLEESGDMISYNQGLRVMDKCNRIMTWLEVTGLTAEVEYRRKQKELEDFCHVEETAPNLVVPEFFEQVRCGNCSKYLSYFPVYISAEKTICGRCSQFLKPKKLKGFVRDTLYESLVKSCKFPCVYNLNGCLENLLPVDVQDHERSCHFRSLSCPTVSCVWKGIIKNFLQHFQETHPDSILGKDDQFGLYFVGASEHHYLFVYKEELFDIKQTFSVSENAAVCSFKCYKLKNSDTQYSYRLTLQNGPGTRSITLSSETADGSEESIIRILVEDVIAKLENPSRILASVKIASEAENEDTQATRPQDQKLNSSEVKYDLLAELECPVCFYYITPPIYQCITGHSICCECKKLVTRCPSCGAEFKNTQNFTLEKMASLLTYPCKFAEKGCGFASKPEDMKVHHKCCAYGPLKCPFQEYNDCLWSDSSNNLWSHILNYHNKSLLETNTINVCVDCDYLNKEDFSCYMMGLSRKLFKLHYQYKEGFFYWAAQLIDPSENASDYRFEIDIVDNSKKGQKMCFRKLCSPSKERDSSFDSRDDCIVVGFNLIKPFLLTNILTYQVRIVR